MRFWLWIAAFAAAAGQGGGKQPATLAVYVVGPCGQGAGPRVSAGDGPALCREGAPFLTQTDVASAEIQRSSKGHPMVFLTFQDEAARRELQVTRKIIGNRVAIVVNGKVVATPMVSAASRLLYIDGNYTQEEAEALVMAFNRGIQQRSGKR